MTVRLTCPHPPSPPSPRSPSQMQHHRWQEPSRHLELILSKLLTELRRCEGREEGPLAQGHTAPGSGPDSISPGAQPGVPSQRFLSPQGLPSVPRTGRSAQHERCQGAAKNKPFRAAETWLPGRSQTRVIALLLHGGGRRGVKFFCPNAGGLPSSDVGGKEAGWVGQLGTFSGLNFAF